MQNYTKIIAVAGMLAVIAGIAAATTMEQAQAQTVNPVNPNAPTESSDAPTAKLISIQRYTSAPYAGEAGISYKITFSVTAGDTNLRDIMIHAQSDLDSFDYEISSLNALKSAVQVLRIHAIDPDSITGELIGYSLTGPTSSGPDGTGPR
jgi:hypothetical protein